MVSLRKQETLSRTTAEGDKSKTLIISNLITIHGALDMIHEWREETNGSIPRTF
jgi:hypothetical protein